MTLNPWRLTLLEVFERVGTVRAVAAELLLSPSTVSQQLGVLEAEVGTPLFERVGRRLELTSTGLLLVERARQLRDHMDSIESELADLAKRPTGRVRVGGFASSVSSILVPAVTSLAASHPELTVELLEIEPSESTTALLQGRCDVIVTVDESDGTLLSPSLVITPLATDPLRVVLPTGHPSADRSVVRLADLARQQWALDLQGTYLGELVPRLCRLAGFEPTVAGRFSSYGVMLQHVSAGLSVAVLPQLAIGETDAVAARPVDGLADRQIVAAVRAGAARRSAIEVTLDALREAANVIYWPTASEQAILPS
jgi:DNA-binding transcriptional LysR family regulator